MPEVFVFVRKVLEMSRKTIISQVVFYVMSMLSVDVCEEPRQLPAEHC